MNIIDGFQKKYIRIIEKFITVIGWLFMLGYIVQIILSLLIWIFNLSNFYKQLFILGSIYRTINTLLITIVISFLGFLIMYGWGRYNFKRYAHLKRRRFPDYITIEGLAKYFNLSLEVVETMQNDKIIILEKTIV